MLGSQTTATIPRADADYLRTIETLSVSDLTDLTRALLRLSDNVSTLSTDVSSLARYVKVVWIPIAIGILVAILTIALK